MNSWPLVALFFVHVFLSPFNLIKLINLICRGLENYTKFEGLKKTKIYYT